MSKHLKVTGLFAAMLAISMLNGCAQMSHVKNDIKNTFNDDGDRQQPISPTQPNSNNNAAVIYIYPAKGAVSKGRYYRLPLDKTKNNGTM